MCAGGPRRSPAMFVQRIDEDRLSPDVGERHDFGLSDEMIEAVVAPAHDGDIDIGLVFHREGIVDRRMGDLIAAFGESAAQLIRVGRKLDVDVEPAFGKKPLACPTKIGRFGTPGKTMTASLVLSARVVPGIAVKAKAVVIAAASRRLIIASSPEFTLSHSNCA